jgi:hypothetical protein
MFRKGIARAKRAACSRGVVNRLDCSAARKDGGVLDDADQGLIASVEKAFGR